MPRVAIVTDSGADIPSERAAAAGIRVAPLIVTFGEESFVSGVDITTEGFYERLTAPGSPFPRTAACSPEVFRAAFTECLEDGADAVLCITLGSRLSATHDAARVARDAMPGAPIHLVDSGTASMTFGQVVLMAAEAAASGADLETVVGLVEATLARARVYVALDTLENLRRGGRISAAQAAIGSVLSVKPIITVENGVVETVDRPRTRQRARARLLELLSERPIERMVVLHTQAPDVGSFADEVCRRTGLLPADVEVGLIGPVVAAHVGPGAVGAAIITQAG